MQFIFVFLFLFEACFPQGRIDGIVAIVGKNMVLHSDVLQQAQFAALEQHVDPSKNPYLFEEIYFNTRDNIINQYALLGIAEKDTNLIVSNEEVDRALSQQIDDFILRAGSEEQFLEMAGTSMRQIKIDYWKDIHDMMVVEKYQFSKIQNIDVSRQEVHKFYNTYKDSIPSLPEQYDFSLIEVPFVSGDESDEKTRSFLAALKSDIKNKGLSFDSLAQIHSQDPGTAPLGGHLGYTLRGSLVKEYEEAAYSLKPGDISEPIKTSFGYHLIRLLERRGEKILTQHILRTVGFSEKDKKNSYSIVNDIILKIDNDSLLFDSLANIFSNKYKNYSGKYKNYSPSDIPSDVLLSLKQLNLFDVSSPIETNNGYALIFYYNHRELVDPNLINSWDLIYNYAKQKKQNLFFQSLIKKTKNKIYLRTMNE